MADKIYKRQANKMKRELYQDFFFVVRKNFGQILYATYYCIVYFFPSCQTDAYNTKKIKVR